ncbi:non-structural maintenance of chromosomes element 3 homolog [Melitaea cinxia]|uniref:non-structural maintenance of chromosomes element 3 homolog n=1 Tax=Melitaea cinxia TaxID=113334 RepID=UPI001E26EC2B|nr:non-structural maintenance of chromosomes element 3 homolog [Melitaea cinxia]
MSHSPVNECVKYIICRDARKVPIDRSDIRLHLKHYFYEKLTPNDLRNIISKADEILNKVYGYKLVPVGPNNDKYIVTLKKDEKNAILSTYINPQHRKLLIATLTHIFMTAQPVPSDDMWWFLTTAQLMTRENENEVKKLLMRTFTQELYINYNKNDDKFEWGQRAKKEIPKIFLLEKMAQAFDKEPSHWTEQYRKAMEEANSDETLIDGMEIE